MPIIGQGGRRARQGGRTPRKSWLAAYDKPVDGYDTIMFNAVNSKYIPRACVRKCDTWVMLTRAHAHACLIGLPRAVGTALWPHFSRVKVADEIFMPTMMTIIGAIRSGGIPGAAPAGQRAPPSDDDVERRKVTHVDWSAAGPHPKAFDAFAKNVQDAAISEGCIFARKFAEGTVNLKSWHELCGVDGDDLQEAVGQNQNEEQNQNTTSSSRDKPVPEFKGRRDTLVIVCAGDTSLHDEERWFSPAREFHLCVVYYGNDDTVAARFERESDFFHRQAGPKWQLIRAVLHKGFWERYEYIWMPDDDLALGTVGRINEFFSIARKYRLNLCQPALEDLNVEHRLLVRRPGLVLRFTNFVEIMAPLLHKDALHHLMPTLDTDEIKSAWGLDFVWPFLLNFKAVAVVDQTPMTHTRPVTAFNPDSNFYRKFNIDPMLEGHNNMTRYGLSSNTKPRCLQEVRQ